MLAFRVFIFVAVTTILPMTTAMAANNRPDGSRSFTPKRIATRTIPPMPARNGLPPTVMDSFVAQAAEHADHIYGDEGTTSIPPYQGFNVADRINTGILDQRDRGLTTGHGSYLPDGVGGDEFTGNEWSGSGPSGRTQAQGFPDGLPNLSPAADGSYAMSQADVQRARQALADGDFFKWDGTQSSQSRSR